MSIPIIGERNYPYIVVGVTPGVAPDTFEIQLDTQHFPGGVPLAVQCLLQAAMSLLPHAFQSIAELAVQQLMNQKRIQNNGEI